MIGNLLYNVTILYKSNCLIVLFFINIKYLEKSKYLRQIYLENYLINSRQLVDMTTLNVLNKLRVTFIKKLTTLM